MRGSVVTGIYDRLTDFNITVIVVITIEFQQPTYTLLESNDVSLCVVIAEGSSDIPFAVDIIILEDTAQG